MALRAAFGDDLPRHVHILLAGNASRSKLVSDLFGVLSSNAERRSLFVVVRSYFVWRSSLDVVKPFVWRVEARWFA